MKVKVGDKVRVLAGKDKGKEGTITSILRKKDRVVVSGVNVVKKHIKPSAYNENGGIVEVEASIHVSNVKVIEGTKAAKAEKKTTAKVEAKEEKKTATKKTTAEKATKTEKTAKTTKKTTKKESGEK